MLNRLSAAQILKSILYRDVARERHWHTHLSEYFFFSLVLAAQETANRILARVALGLARRRMERGAADATQRLIHALQSLQAPRTST
jgi:hypothetical protein